MDALGTYEATMFGWGNDPCDQTSNPPCPQQLMQTEIRTYESDPGAVVFVQAFPKDLGPDEHTATAADSRSREYSE